MQYTIELLVNGDPKVGEYYRRGVARWKEIWSRPDSKHVYELATMIEDEEPWFEEHCGTRWVGQEIMVLSGFGMLYTTETGFGGNLERARLLYDAFMRSFCSIEAQAIAQKVAVSYRVLKEVVAYEPVSRSPSTL
ncbi:MAG TPA: hypothetical protein VEL76_17790 [Gemmataceae bacterium]|nr:hypothetical protein [Gemmataceae bacterium]